jgi:single-strand DNA-binding protein
MQLYSLIGNLGADAKIVDNNGKPFISFNVADTDRWKDEGGNIHESTTWVQCTLNGGAAENKVFEYLKAGTKVFVMGRMRTRVYSSEKERRMVAGVNLYVMQVELVGGSSDEVPRKLIDPKDATIHNVYKAYYVRQEELATMSKQLVDKAGMLYNVNEYGFIVPVQAEQKVEESAPQAENETDTNDAPFTGEDNPDLIAKKVKNKK